MRFHRPRHQKAASIRAIRAELRKSVADWFRANLPGLFSGGILAGQFPTCELLTLRDARPFPLASDHEADPGEWLRLFDLRDSIDVWVAGELPGVRFAWPLWRGEETQLHATLAAKEDDFSSGMLNGYGEGRHARFLYTDSHMNTLLSRWALLGVVEGFEHMLTRTRDLAALRSSGSEPLKLLENIEALLSESIDVSAVSIELRAFASRASSFGHEVESFAPANPPVFYGSGVTLSEWLSEQTSHRAQWLENTNRAVRDLLCQHSAVLGTRENVRLQRKIDRMSSILILLAAATVALTAWTLMKPDPQSPPPRDQGDTAALACSTRPSSPQQSVLRIGPCPGGEPVGRMLGTENRADRNTNCSGSTELRACRRRLAGAAKAPAVSRADRHASQEPNPSEDTIRCGHLLR